MKRCNATVHRRDTYRVNRTGKGTGFKMHYQRGQCSRLAVKGDYCWQHSRPEVYAYPYFTGEQE